MRDPAEDLHLVRATLDHKHRARCRRLLRDAQPTSNTDHPYGVGGPPRLWPYAAERGLLHLGPDRARALLPFAPPLPWDRRQRLNLGMLAANLPVARAMVGVLDTSTAEMLLADADRVAMALTALAGLHAAGQRDEWR